MSLGGGLQSIPAPSPRSATTHKNTLMVGWQGHGGGRGQGRAAFHPPPPVRVATSGHQFQLTDPISQSWGEVAEGRAQGGSRVPLLYLITIIV